MNDAHDADKWRLWQAAALLTEAGFYEHSDGQVVRPPRARPADRGGGQHLGRRAVGR